MNPVDSTDAAVIFSHSFLNDRVTNKHFRELAKRYRAAGYATLLFDYSGHGASGDDVITTDLRVEDLRAASGWLADQGFPRQLLHAHSSGTMSAFRANPRAVEAIFATSAVTGPRTYDWEAIFSPAQLEALEKRRTMVVPDDSPGVREEFHVSSQTLIDLSLNRKEDLLAHLTLPTLLVFDGDDVHMGLADSAAEAFPDFPDGSRVEVDEDVAYGDIENLDRLWDHARVWANLHVPVRPPLDVEAGK